jgi:hypothetical protein
MALTVTATVTALTSYCNILAEFLKGENERMKE